MKIPAKVRELYEEIMGETCPTPNPAGLTLDRLQSVMDTFHSKCIGMVDEDHFKGELMFLQWLLKKDVDPEVRERLEWLEMIARIGSGERVEISKKTYWYFLEVLPPVFMHKTVELSDGTFRKVDFGSADGYELIRGFWKDNDKFFCQLTKQMNTT